MFPVNVWISFFQVHINYKYIPLTTDNQKDNQKMSKYFFVLILNLILNLTNFFL